MKLQSAQKVGEGGEEVLWGNPFAPLLWALSEPIWTSEKPDVARSSFSFNHDQNHVSPNLKVDDGNQDAKKREMNLPDRV